MGVTAKKEREKANSNQKKPVPGARSNREKGRKKDAEFAEDSDSAALDLEPIPPLSFFYRGYSEFLLGGLSLPQHATRQVFQFVPL